MPDIGAYHYADKLFIDLRNCSSGVTLIFFLIGYVSFTGAIIQQLSNFRSLIAFQNPFDMFGALDTLHSIAIRLEPFSKIKSISVPDDVL